MDFKRLPKLRIGDLEANIPIVQGGMGVGISLSGLASAVANEGGIGVISAAGIGMLESDSNSNYKEANKKALRKEIKKAREMTTGIIGVNIMVALSDYYDLLQVAVDECVDLVFLGAGLPLKIPQTLLPDGSEKVTAKVVPIVSSARAARLIFQYWEKHYNHVPDAVVVEGPLAGGHLGFRKEQIRNRDYTLEKILPEIISVIKPYEEHFNKSIPVIAAGGVYTGADIYKFIQLGAQGVQMATRFVATHECDASIEFKNAYLNCRKEDLTIIDSPVGLPGRAIQNQFLEKVSAGNKRPFKCHWVCLKTCDIKSSPYCICAALTNAKKGRLEQGFAFAGANAYRVNTITSVKKLIGTLLTEYDIAFNTKHPEISKQPESIAVG
jgi:NAD(P)H-dependent flavin oxidoreductase YrpB (nitropropane dioxygenase family)